MLTAHPHPHTETAKQVIRSWQRVQTGWPRFLLIWACAFQFVIAVTLAAAPYQQVLTPGTRPVLEMASRFAWAGMYLASAMFTASTPWLRPLFRLVAWIGVMGLGGVWLTAFCVNVLSGGGSAVGVVAWFFLYVPVAAVALHQSLSSR